ncbi:hypothetical protein U725_02816 [Lactococcus cremoris subsp. cremoris GE214]|uniref:Uncharacterized protein n=1 Tax=Lactococcus cremoris subsp. cremoris GE214 TaxID=1415168 RepID=A0A084A6X9_LACLC|nr:hypothetical protein U725_02816 [Lactococcus cremoris subsp. cremoris GE214]
MKNEDFTSCYWIFNFNLQHSIFAYLGWHRFSNLWSDWFSQFLGVVTSPWFYRSESPNNCFCRLHLFKNITSRKSNLKRSDKRCFKITKSAP